MPAIEALTLLLLLVGLVLMIWLMRRKRGRLGPGALGAVEPFMLQGQRQGAQVIIEERAAERDSETADGRPEA
jgi:hypothetical protein